MEITHANPGNVTTTVALERDGFVAAPESSRQMGVGFVAELVRPNRPAP
jgi:adenine/guanine phosphoribosyltransferase-like PRPP-binding protein